MDLIWHNPFFRVKNVKFLRIVFVGTFILIVLLSHYKQCVFCLQAVLYIIIVIVVDKISDYIQVKSNCHHHTGML